uniref:Glutamic acid-rich protein n=1 Tax=Globodera pallida TaxID=36090 RepID=A0A183BPH1_GLOPA
MRLMENEMERMAEQHRREITKRHRQYRSEMTGLQVDIATRDKYIKDMTGQPSMDKEEDDDEEDENEEDDDDDEEEDDDDEEEDDDDEEDEDDDEESGESLPFGGFERGWYDESEESS